MEKIGLLCVLALQKPLPPPPLSSRHMFLPLPAAAGQGKGRLLSSLFSSVNEIDYRVWNGTEIAPTPGQRIHRLAFWSSNISHWDTRRGGRARAPQVVHYEHNNLLRTKGRKINKSRWSVGLVLWMASASDAPSAGALRKTAKGTMVGNRYLLTETKV